MSPKILLLLVLAFPILQAQPPQGWVMAGDRPTDYDCSVDPAVNYAGQPAVSLKSKAGIETHGFGTILQSFPADQYVGKRVRFSAWLKSEDVSGPSWVTLWMRFDDTLHRVNGYNKTLAFGNLRENGPDLTIKGTTEWQQRWIVLDVPPGTTSIYLGFALHGSGAAWMSGNKFEIVGPDVPVTPQRTLLGGPTNLGFER